MKIVIKKSFLQRLGRQVDFIANDSVKRARKFSKEILEQINKIPDNPYINRKSIYFNEESIRDLIYKGYTVVYRICDDEIQVFGFVKYQELPIDGVNNTE
ncbi:MAG TPA: type II toxin-antitoxin system RelE/ParE family toxin [Bacteroidales bacterium]|nr:type II toxin-antitoxin system RelE/ParE family toxin [Bacteroidales bacterium]